MDANKYTRSINLMCPTCGGTEFAMDGEGENIVSARCVSCDRILTADELMRENGELIEANVDEMKDELLKDATRELRDGLKSAFLGSKNIKFR